MNINIRPFSRQDIPYKVDWINDPLNNKYLHYDLPLTYSGTSGWFERIKHLQGLERLDLTIELDGNPVGIIGLLNIVSNKHAEYYIMLDHHYNGKGIAQEATKQILDIAFNKLYLPEVYLFTERENHRAQALFERSGFTRGPLLKRHLIHEGRKIDRFKYSVQALFNSIVQEYLPLNIPNPIFTQPFTMNINQIERTLFVMREDLLPVYFGGNKARKGLFFSKYIEYNRIDCVLTYGSVSSNHARVVALIAAEQHIPCLVVTPQGGDESSNTRINRLLNCEIIEVPVENVESTIEQIMKKLKLEYSNPWFIPGGGHNFLGTLSYVDLYRRYKLWRDENNIPIDAIFFASGTGSTQAGLSIGQFGANGNEEIIGISIARESARGIEAIEEAIDDYYKVLDFKGERPMINFQTDYRMGGYGRWSENLDHLLSKVFLNTQLPLEPMYTGKAYNGMLEYLKQRPDLKHIMFIHTGGTPLFFDYVQTVTTNKD